MLGENLNDGLGQVRTKAVKPTLRNNLKSSFAASSIGAKTV